MLTGACAAFSADAEIDLRVRAARVVDELCARHGIGLCALGPMDLIAAAPAIIANTSGRIILSADIACAADALSAARAMVDIALIAPDGAANFRFAAAARIPPASPFFPVARADGV